MAKVSLDALLPREDFDVEDIPNSAKKKESFSISDLREDDFFYSALRKPDFQRETSEWDPKKIVELIKSFIYGELIPAVILWRSKGGFNFVIDGSHRVSSLVAWINDDYGDGPITRDSFNGVIPEEQIEIGNKTRSLVEKEIGKYTDYQLALKYPERVTDEVRRNSKNLGSIAVQLQWVEGDADVAEASFFKINQQAAKIDPTELKLIKSRKKPNGIAARAIIKGGKGHQYWSKFEEEKVKMIEVLAKDINQAFFLPKLSNPVKTLDLPIGGKGYSSQSPLLVFEYVNMVNNIKDLNNLAEDIDGEQTVSFLKKCKKTANLINSSHSWLPLAKGNLDELVGIVKAKDVLSSYLKLEYFELESALQKPLIVPKSMTAFKLLDLFKKSGIHIALVIDEFGGFTGLVTVHDILEQLVGDMPQEDDEQQIITREDGSWLVDGLIPIEIFKEYFDIKELPLEDVGEYHTLGGFITAYLGNIPKVTDCINLDDLKIEIIDMDKARVDKVLILKIK